MQALVLLGQWLFGRLPFCALVGAIAGAVAGAFMGLILPAIPPGPVTWAHTVEAGLMLAVAGWFAVLLIVGVWARYGVAQIWAPAAVNAVLTAILTVWVNELIRLPWLATIIGILAGVVVGLILCRLCPAPPKGSVR
jgi:hypothetical protein